MVNLSCRKPIIFYDFNYEEEFPSITFNVLHNLSSGIRARKVACKIPQVYQLHIFAFILQNKYTPSCTQN